MADVQELVTLDQVIAHLKLPSDYAETDQGDDLQAKLDAAHVLCLDYVKQRRSDEDGAWAEEVDGWTDETAPKWVIAAILMMTGDLFRNRGDEEPDSMPKQDDGRFPFKVRMLLDRYRDPTIA